MWQLIGLMIFLVCNTLLQLFWPWPIYGHTPHLLLISGCLILIYTPKTRLYLALLVCVASFDILLGEGMQTLIAVAIAAQLPLHQGGQSDLIKSSFKIWGLCLVSVLIFEVLMAMLNLVHGSAAIKQLFYTLPLQLILQSGVILILRKPVQLLSQMLHYQRSEFEGDIFKGELG